jgi:polyphosphate kinase
LTQALLDDQAALLRHDLVPKLAEAGVEIVDYDHLEDEARRELTEWFDQSVFPILTPQAIDRGRRFPHVSNRSINLIVSLRLPVGARFARIKIPATLPRLVPIATPAPGVPPAGCSASRGWSRWSRPISTASSLGPTCLPATRST